MLSSLSQFHLEDIQKVFITPLFLTYNISRETTAPKCWAEAETYYFNSSLIKSALFCSAHSSVERHGNHVLTHSPCSTVKTHMSSVEACPLIRSERTQFHILFKSNNFQSNTDNRQLPYWARLGVREGIRLAKISNRSFFWTQNKPKNWQGAEQ